MQSFPAMGNVGGPTRTRTWDQWIRLCPAFLPGADYLITLAHVLAGRDEHAVGCGTLKPVIKDAWARSPSPQVVSAPSGGVPPAWLRVAGSRQAR